MESVKRFLKTAEKLAADNSPAILTSIGVVGTVTTAALTAKATIKADRILLRDTYENQSNVFFQHDVKDRVNLTWRCYIPPVVMGTATVVCIVGANRVGTRRAAAMAAAYTISEKTFEDYRAKVVEKLGDTKEQQVRDEVAQERVRKDNGHQGVVVATGKVLCYDAYSGRYFESSMEEIKKAQNDLNYKVLNYGYASLNEFYDSLGLGETSVGEEVGWRSDQMLELEISSVLSDDQRPCISINYRVDPARNYYRFS